MTTTADLINETKRYLLSTYSEPLNKLNGAHDAATTTLTFVYDIGSIRAGSYLSIDLEIVYVWSVSGTAATVERGVQGSTAASHNDGTVVTINPKFPDFSILQAINTDLRDLSGRGLFKVGEVEFTFIAGTYGYDMQGVTSLISGIDARYDPPGREKDWPQLRQWKIRRNSDTADFPSGFAFVLSEEAHPGRAVRVTYSAPYSELSTLTDDVLTVSGLQAEGHDIVSLGAAFRLNTVREVQRNFNEAQPNPRRSEEVRGGDILNASRGLMQLREQRINSLRTLLNKQYPNRRAIR